MGTEPDDSSHHIPSNAITSFSEMSLHGQELDLNKLHKLDSFLATNDTNTQQDPSIPDREVDLDDILPSESFSTQVSPTTSLVDGIVHKKPSISIFEQTDEPNVAIGGLPSPPKTPVTKGKDDLPTRCSDIEDSPPLVAAGFVGNEIPNVDPLDSDGEWQPIPTLADLFPTKNAVNKTVDGEESQEMGVTEEKKRRKRRKKKSKGVKGNKALELEKNPADLITGFEEYYAEPPMKPDEADEEEAMYDTKFNVAARAEKVVQRYRAARRFNIDRERIFSAYLTFGGIRTGPKQFQGLDPKMEGTAEDFAAASAKDAVEESVLNDTEVDFEWVIRGFLSYYFPVNHGWKSDDDIILACDVLMNFLNYIEFHNVFPEYADNIISAKATVQKGKHELVINRKCSNLLPGHFNIACSTYFGGHYQGLYSGSSDEEFEHRYTNRKAMTFLRRARNQKFLAERKIGEWSFPCVVVEITADQEMVLKQWIPEGGEQDFVEPDLKDTEIKIFLEKEILNFVYVGMHIEATWHQTSGGTWYMDQVTNVLPTFAIEVPDEEYPEDDPEIV